jgi:hypothetical protein
VFRFGLADVRRGLPRRNPPKFMGYALDSGSALQTQIKSRTKGAAQIQRGMLHGGAEPPPHIRRQTRSP